MDDNEITIIIYFAMFYMSLVCIITGIYLRSLYIQYKNAHDNWYDIDREQHDFAKYD